jgi:hypothetical protein
MNKSESIINLVQATIKVMSEVKGIDKTMTIGSGENSYKGVSDQEVKKVIGASMEQNGLAIFPIGVEETTNIDIFDDQWKKRKQNIFSKVVTKYLLCHESGEFIEIVGYGHGVDSQDKSAGKATTYALKYALLYTFMVPTGKIDDADKTHSDDLPVTPPPPPPPLKAKTPELSPELEKQLTQSIALLDNITDMEKLKAVWENQPELQNIKLFKDAVNTAKKRLS